MDKDMFEGFVGSTLAGEGGFSGSVASTTEDVFEGFLSPDILEGESSEKENDEEKTDVFGIVVPKDKKKYLMSLINALIECGYNITTCDAGSAWCLMISTNEEDD